MINKNNYVKDINTYHEYSLAVDHEGGSYYLYTDEDVDMGIFDACPMCEDSDQPIGSVESAKQLIQLIIYDMLKLSYFDEQLNNNKVTTLMVGIHLTAKDIEKVLANLGILVKPKDVEQVVAETRALTLKQLKDILF